MTPEQFRLDENSHGNHYSQDEDGQQRPGKGDGDALSQGNLPLVEHVNLERTASALHGSDGAAEVMEPCEHHAELEVDLFPGGTGKGAEAGCVTDPRRKDKSEGKQQEPFVGTQYGGPRIGVHAGQKHYGADSEGEQQEKHQAFTKGQ
jgi:hypothetical protein